MDTIGLKFNLDTDPAEQAMMATHRKGRDLFEKKGFNLNLKSGNLPLGRITGDFDKFSGSLDAATARVLAFTATTTVVYGLATAFNRLFTDSIKLEKQLAGIQAILQTSNSNLQKFSSELFQVANATGQSFDVAAAAASEFARQGLSVEETLKATNAALTFSKIAGTDAAQTVENLTAALNTFAGEALTYTDVLDTIVSLDNAFAISAAGISDGLKRVGSVASASGIQLKEIASLIAVVQQVSARGAPVISNGLKTIFTRLSRTNVQETLNSIGVTTQDSNGEFRSQIDVLTDLANKLDTLSDKQRAFVLEQVAGVYQINTLQATLKSLTGEYSLFDKAVKVASDSSGNAAERLKILTDTTDANLQKLKNNVTQFLAETGKATVKPVLDSFIGIGNKILETLNLGAAAEGGEKAGVSIGKVLLNGISSALAGPGSVLLIVTITRLLSKITKDAFTAVQTLAGLKKVSLVDEKVQMAVNRAIEMGNKGLVDRLRTATSLVEKARILQTLMADMDRKLAMAQVKQAVQTGLAANAKTVAPGARKAAGYIPNFSKGFIPNFSKGAIPKPLEELEKKTARLKAYEPGKVIPAPNGGVMSTAETVTEIEFKGKKDFVISPPQYSIAGRDHAKDFEKQYGANIYNFIGKKSVTAKGFIPNFLDPEYIEQRKAERIPKEQRTPEQQAVRDTNAAEVKRGRKELINIGDFAGGKVYNDKAEEQFRIAIKNRNVEWDDKITNVGFEVIEIDVGEDRPQKTLPDGSKKNASTNFKNSIVKKPKGDITNLTNKFEAFAIRQLNKRKDRDFNFQKARLTAFGAGNSSVDGYSINPAKNSIDLLEVKSGDWKTPSHISNKIGRFVPENIATLGKPIESLFKESNRAPYSFDTIKLRNILAVPKITKQKFAGSPKKELIDKKWTSILNYKGEKPSVIAKNLNLLPVTKQDVQRQFGGNANASTPSFTIQNGRLVPTQPAKKPTAKQEYQSKIANLAAQRGIKLRAEGFIPNFVRASSMIGRGAEGSFHKLTEDIGVKRFHRSTRAGNAAHAYNLTETIKSEFAISKLLARKKELVPGITGPKIPDKLNRALQAGSIRKQIIKEPLARDSVGRDASMYFGQILRSRLSKAGLLMDDLHGSNYTLNAQGQEFINKNKNKFKWKSSLDNPSFLYSSSSSSSNSSLRPLSPLLTPGAKKDYIYDQFVKSGGKVTIIDAGFTDVINPNLKKQVSEYRRKTNSRGFIPNFANPFSSRITSSSSLRVMPGEQARVDGYNSRLFNSTRAIPGAQAVPPPQSSRIIPPPKINLNKTNPRGKKEIAADLFKGLLKAGAMVYARDGMLGDATNAFTDRETDDMVALIKGNAQWAKAWMGAIGVNRFVADAAKNGLRVAGSLQKALTGRNRTSAAGFIPNFSSPLSSPKLSYAEERKAIDESIGAEMTSGFKRSEVSIGSRASFKNDLNPRGLAVFNDEEGTLSKGVSFAKMAKEDLTTKRTYGDSLSGSESKTAAFGFIPNFTVAPQPRLREAYTPAKQKIKNTVQGFKERRQEVDPLARGALSGFLKAGADFTGDMVLGSIGVGGVETGMLGKIATFSKAFLENYCGVHVSRFVRETGAMGYKVTDSLSRKLTTLGVKTLGPKKIRSSGEGFIPNFATSKEIRAQKRAQRKKEQREKAANLKPKKVLPSSPSDRTGSIAFGNKTTLSAPTTSKNYFSPVQGYPGQTSTGSSLPLPRKTAIPTPIATFPAVNQPLGSKLFNGPAGMNPFGTKNRPSQTKNSLLVSAKAFNGPGQTSTGSSLPVPSKPANLKPPTVLPTPRALPRSPSNSTGSIYKRKSNNFNFGSNTNPNYFSSSAQTSTGSSTPRQIGSGISSVPTNTVLPPPLNPRQIGSGISSVPTNILNRAPAPAKAPKTMDPSRGLGLATAAAFAIPALTGMISTPAEGEEQTKGQKIAQGTGEALGAGIMAASVALMIPAFAPLALGIGLVVASFKGLKSISDASIPSLSNLKKENDKVVQSAESQTNSLTEAVKAQEELSQLKESGGDPRKIANAQLKFAKSLSGIKDTNLVSTLTNEKDDVKKQEAIVTYQEKINQDLKFSQGNLATQTIIQQSQKQNSSLFDPITGRQTKTKAFKAEDFSLYLDPIIESLDFTKDATGKAAEGLKEVANGTKNWEVFLKEFGTTLGMSEAQVKMARDTYNGLNGEFTDESLKALDKTAAATAIYNKNLKESIVTEKPTFNIDIQGVFDKALKSLTLDTALINYKNFASAGTDLGIEQNRLNLESQSGRLTETVATNRSADLKIKELKLETDKKGTQLISDAVDDLIKIIPKETSTEQKSNILNQANAVLRGGGDISSLENVIKQTLNSSDKSKEVLTQIANISQKTVEGIEKLRIDQAEGTRSINVIAQDQLKESQKINKEEIGRSTLAEPPKYANKLMDTGAVLETDAKIQKLRSKAERSGGARTEQGRKLLLEASNLEMQNDRIKSKDELAQAERYGKDNVVKRTDAERSGMTQIQKNMADDIGQKLKDLNTTRGKSGKSSIFSSQDIKKITDGIQIGGEGATESRRMLEEKLNNPNYAQDSTFQSFAREIKSVGGSNSIFANNSQMPAVSGANVPIAASAGVAGTGFPTVPSAAGAGAPTVPSVATGGSGVPMIPSTSGAGAPTVPSVATGGSGVPMIPSTAGVGAPTVPSVATGGSGAQMALGSAQLPTGQSFTSGSIPRNQSFETIQKIVDIEKNNKDYADFEAEKERNKKLKQQRDVLSATPLSVLKNNIKLSESLALPNIAPEVSGNMGGMGGMVPRATIFEKQQSDFLKRMQSGEQLTEKDFEDLKASVNVNKETGKARDKLDSSRRQSFVEQVQKSGYVFKEDLGSVESKITSTEVSRRTKLNAGQTTEQEDRDLKALEERQALLKLKPEQLEEQIKRSDEDLIKRQGALKPVIAGVESMANGTGYSKGLAERLMGGPKRPVIKEKNQPKFHAVGASMLLLESYKQDKDDLEKEMETNASSIKGMEASRSSASTPEEDKALVDARNKQKELIAKRDAANAKIKEREADLEEAPKLTQSYLQEQKNAIIPETYFEDKQIALYETQLGKGLKERIANGKVAKKGSTEKADERIAELEGDLKTNQITTRAEDGTVSVRRSTDEEKSIQKGQLEAARKERESIVARNAQIDSAPLGSPIMEPLTADEQINTQKQIDEIAAKNPQTVAALEEAKRRKREKESQKGKVQSTEGYDVGIARLKDELVNGRTKMGTEGYLKGVFTKTKLTKDEEEKTKDSIAELEAERKKIQDNNAKITQYDQGIAKADQAYLTQSPLDYYKTAQTQMRGIAPGTELQDRKVKQAEDSIARGKEIEDKLKNKKATKAEKEKGRGESEGRLKKLREERDAIKAKPPLTEMEIFEKGFKIKQERKAKGVRYGSKYETADVREVVMRQEEESQYQALKVNQKQIYDEENKKVRFETKNEDADIADLESRRYTREKMAEEEKRLADARAQKQASAGKVQSTKGYDTQISSFEDLLKNGRTTLGPKGEKVITPLTEEEKIKTQTSLEQAKEQKSNVEAQNAQIVGLQGKQDKAKQRLKFSDPQEYLRILNEEEDAKKAEKDSVMTADRQSYQKLTTLKTEREKIKGQLDRGFKDMPLTPEEQKRAEEMKKEDEKEAMREELLALEVKKDKVPLTEEETKRLKELDGRGGATGSYTDEDYRTQSKRWYEKELLEDKTRIEAKPVNERTNAEKTRLEELSTGKDKERVDAAIRDQEIRAKASPDGPKTQIPLTKEDRAAQQQALKLKDREIFDEEMKKKELAAQLPQTKDEKARQEEIKSAQDRVSRLDPVKMQNAAIAKLKASKDPNLQGVGAQMESISQKELELKTLNDPALTPEEQKRFSEMEATKDSDAKDAEYKKLDDISFFDRTPEQQARRDVLDKEVFDKERGSGKGYNERRYKKDKRDSNEKEFDERAAIEAIPEADRTQEQKDNLEYRLNLGTSKQVLDEVGKDRAIRAKVAGAPEAKKKAETLKTQIDAEKQALGTSYDQNRGAIDQTLYKGQVAPMLAEKITNPEDQLKVTEFNDKVQERQAKEAELDPINKKIGDIEAKRKERSAVASEAGKALTGDGVDNDRKRAIFSKFTSGELTAEEANKQSGGQLGAAFDRVSKNRMNKQAADQAKADLATSGDTAEERIRKKEVYGKFSRGEITQAEADKQTGGGLKAAFAKVVPDQNAPKFGDLNNVGNIKEEEKRKAEIEKQVAKTKEEENTLGAAIKPLLDAVTALTAAQTATKQGGAAGTTTEGGAAAPTEQGGEKKITTNSNVNVTVTGGSLTDAHVVQLQEGLQTFTIDNINKAFVNAGLPAPNLGPPAATTAVV